ncbi:hypothetical protein PV327_010481 [Microctonus hyperodae]|uniref:Ribonuclease P/MRP protein subunit POP5 n=1 Tax=Microctonus hyperodae TaxID=165561 RepID=A0AA39KV19_MICHY|nr:hypothetical protein PV327_010481 [Microctonus hyperodae]
MVRFKNRYIVIEITPKDKEDKPWTLKSSALQCAVQKKVQQFFGDFGQAAIKSGFSATYCNEHTKIALIRGRHGPHKFLMKAIPAINDIAGKFVSVEILYVGATMKHCFIFIRNHQIKKIESVWKSLKNDQERQKVIDTLMTLTSATKDLK